MVEQGGVLPSIWSLLHSVDPCLPEESLQFVMQLTPGVSRYAEAREQPRRAEQSLSCGIFSTPVPARTVSNVEGSVLQMKSPQFSPERAAKVMAPGPRNEIEQPKPATERELMCSFPGCRKTFSSSKVLNNHKRQHSSPKHRHPCPLPNCSSSFRIKSELDHHTRIHAGIRDFKCESCSKTFCHKSHLTRHMRLHTGARPYACEEPGCGKQFTRSDDLRLHLRKHTGERPYVCKVCHQGFMQSTSLRRHEQSHDV